MKLKQLKISYNGLERVVPFEKKSFIHSNQNSAGKSTLLRLLFYSMGYSIPQTKGIQFKNVETKLVLQNLNGLIEVHRSNDVINLTYEDQTVVEYYMPSDEDLVLSEIWSCKNINVINSILGSIYMDQEKGWTLLNRGTVIGSIKFKIEDLLEGLSERDISNQKLELENVNFEIRKYSQILNILEYRNKLAKQDTVSLFSSNYVEELETQLQLIKIRKRELISKTCELELSLKENNQFVKYIEKMKLVVKDEQTGIEVPVSEDTLIHFIENQRYTKARIALLGKERAKADKEIKNLILEIQKASNLFSLQSEIEKADYLISKLDIPYDHISQTIISLKKKKAELKNEIKETLSFNNEILNNLHHHITTFAKRLNVDSYITLNKNYIFTSDLKSLSGAILHKIVFSFKMAYIIELQKYLGYNLPIVLDSPSGREVDQKNVEETFDILNDNFKNNQVIIASIYKYNNFIPDTIVELKNKIFDE